MFKLVLALAAGLALCGLVAAQPGVYVIGDDNGGSVETYLATFGRLRESKIPVKVDGICISACTLVFVLPPDQFCTTERSTFGFHAVAEESDDGRFIDLPMTFAYAHRYYPKPLGDYLLTLWGEHPPTIENINFLSAAELVNMGVARMCDDAQQE